MLGLFEIYLRPSLRFICWIIRYADYSIHSMNWIYLYQLSNVHFPSIAKLVFLQSCKIKLVHIWFIQKNNLCDNIKSEKESHAALKIYNFRMIPIPKMCRGRLANLLSQRSQSIFILWNHWQWYQKQCNLDINKRTILFYNVLIE